MLMQSGGESKSNSHHYSVRFQRKVHHYQYRYFTLIYKKCIFTDVQTNSSNKSAMGENIYSNSIALGTFDSGKGWFAMCMTQ